MSSSAFRTAQAFREKALSPHKTARFVTARSTRAQVCRGFSDRETARAGDAEVTSSLGDGGRPASDSKRWRRLGPEIPGNARELALGQRRDPRAGHRRETPFIGMDLPQPSYCTK
jgi:hypothetical protein